MLGSIIGPISSLAGTWLQGRVDKAKAETEVKVAKARAMSKGQRRSAVARKQAAGNVGPKPTNVKTILKKSVGGYIGSYIKSEIDGKKISNKSYEKYYKGMI